MEKRENLTLVELLLRMVNNCLSHFALCCVIVIVPTLVMFVLVMWVFKPVYRAEAIVTPPSSEKISASGLGKVLSGSGIDSFTSLLGETDQGLNVVWTFLNSWELHDAVLEKFGFAEHYEFDGKFHADLLKQFRKNLALDVNDEGMLTITFEDEDVNLAADVVRFLTERADSMYNSYMTGKARHSREYMEERLEIERKSMDSLQQEFVKFQTENSFYDPEIQLEATMKYLSTLQGERDVVALEASVEKMQRGEKSLRYEELQKRLRSVDENISLAMKGKKNKVGILALDKSSDLTANYLRLKSEAKIRETVYKFLRQQSEQLQLSEANEQKNLVVLQPAWPNDKKVFPMRGVMLMFTCLVSGILAVIVSCFIEHVKDSDADSPIRKELRRFGGFFRRKKA